MDVVTTVDTPPFATLEIEAYYQSLSEREQKGYLVATKQLGSTFDVVKTRGFSAWKVQQQASDVHTEKKRKEM